MEPAGKSGRQIKPVSFGWLELLNFSDSCDPEYPNSGSLAKFGNEEQTFNF
ncbi:hypothetical protein H6F78_13905 [Coleofasciculus sp. FACHB-64]|uniref:hypothetical protein n=1 Tax=Cyanophyceae TaxID=3028117 RepID=UPI001682CD20|nr:MULTISPECIES: hypothetical protein [unclassified Coleofasciculus]MBD1841102.1 hypothetical protein [Coleofasciculus sp. FACHB-501]MBD1877947.1 hypothetical protein [Coleofasciculus sp. FACHB-T130]MBD1897325.1 hypothetical protein [Coleofasciculus sp. FACHB-129]MBD2046672.1 hypothetical protein [Coleofasciculus sp. FACHB-64]MBD2087181.1 hypothetical protein [Coleofasciculus sp. FACHB-542]